MAQKRISKDIIIHGATEMIEEMGYGNFSLHELAYRLGVRPSSLYNHMKSLEDLKKAISLCAIEQLHSAIKEAGKGKEGKEALVSIAIAIRRFAIKNPELFKTIFILPPEEGGVAMENLIDDQLDGFTLTPTEAKHFTCAYCAAVFGFIQLENQGYFVGSATDASFIAMVALLVASLNQAKKIN
ncbi:MAG: TetR/AcrR family transcriptional regulator [Methanomethylophilus sp.]